MKRLIMFFITLLISLTFTPGLTETAAHDLPDAERDSDALIRVTYQDRSLTLSPEDTATILLWLSDLELDLIEKISVDQYYGQPTVPPGDTYELLIQKDGETDLVLSFVSALDHEDRVLHRFDSDTEDLAVLVLEKPIAFQAYDQIFSLVEKRLYPQFIYELLSAERQIKMVSRGVTIDLTESDGETLLDHLATLLGHQPNPLDETPVKVIEWDVPTSPLGLDRLISGEHYDLRFGAPLDHCGLILLSETNTLPPALVFTDLTRGITLRYDIPAEKRETCDLLIAFLASLSEH